MPVTIVELALAGAALLAIGFLIGASWEWCRPSGTCDWRRRALLARRERMLAQRQRDQQTGRAS